jgi:hypothetical protein
VCRCEAKAEITNTKNEEIKTVSINYYAEPLGRGGIRVYVEIIDY